MLQRASILFFCAVMLGSSGLIPPRIFAEDKPGPPAEEPAEEAEEPKKGKKAKPVLYCVVGVGQDLHAVEQSKLKDFVSQLKKDYKTSLSDWRKARKEARKAKQSFDTLPPKKPKPSVLARNLKGLAKAGTRIARIKAERAKKKAKGKKKPAK